MENATTRDVFEREGWVVVRQLVAQPTLTALRAATSALEQAAAEFELDTMVRGVFFEMQSASGKKGERAISPGGLRKITSPSKGHPAFAKLRRDPRVLAAVASCGIAAPRCLIDQVNFKLPRVGTCFPYHQDAWFLIGDARLQVFRYGGVNAVIALDAADEDNGGFEVLGRTHLTRAEVADYDASVMNHGLFDESRRAVPALAPGDAVLFHPWLGHGSGPNLSDRPRRIITLWFGGGADLPT